MSDGDGEPSSLIVTGSTVANGYRLPRRTDTVKLPALTKDAGGDYQPLRMDIGFERLRKMRSALALAAVRAFEPTVAVIDKTPTGLRGEMIPALNALRAGDCKMVLGLRDIEDSPATVRREWRAARIRDAIRRYYDAILIYGPPSCEDALDCMGWGDLGIPVHHVGYVSAPMPDSGAADLPKDYLLVTLGGGADGFRVLATIVESIRRTPVPCPVVIVTGPLMADAEMRHLVTLTRGLDVRIEEFRADMESVIVGARAVVAMAGYNTVSELLRSERPSLLVPRVSPREEQLMRARAVSDAGLADMLHPDELSPSRMSIALDHLLRRKPARQTAGEGDGARRAASILHRLSQGPVASPAGATPRPAPELSHVA